MQEIFRLCVLSKTPWPTPHHQLTSSVITPLWPVKCHTHTNFSWSVSLFPKLDCTPEINIIYHFLQVLGKKQIQCTLMLQRARLNMKENLKICMSKSKVYILLQCYGSVWIKFQLFFYLLVLGEDQSDKQDNWKEGDDHQHHVGCRVSSGSCNRWK